MTQTAILRLRNRREIRRHGTGLREADGISEALQVVTHVIAIDAAAPIGLAKLIDQAERATWSMVLNTGEACNEVSRGDRAKFLRYAIRSGGECVAAFTILGMYKGPHQNDAVTARDLCREVVRMLTRMIVGPPRDR